MALSTRDYDGSVQPLDALFQPFRVNSLDLQNRLVMAPMGRNMSSAGVVPPTYQQYFRRRVEGGVGLCVSEASAIDHPVSSSDTEHADFFGEKPLAAWADVVREVHQAGGKFLQQIWHAGLLRGKGPDPKLPNDHLPSIGPSGWALPLVHTFGWQAVITAPQVLSEPMTQADIDTVIEAFAQAAAHAKKIGCDGIHIHAAHGYLIDQFFWDRMNLRADGYGGDLRGRTRFAVEVIRECRRRVGPEFPIFLRYSQFKQQEYVAKLASTPAALGQFLEPLADAGVDLFDCSQRRFWEPEFAGSDLNLAGWTKKLTGKPTMTVGSVGLDKANFLEGEAFSMTDSNLGIGRLNILAEMLERGDFDLVAVGRAIVTNPEFANLLKDRQFHLLMPYNNGHLATLD